MIKCLELYEQSPFLLFRNPNLSCKDGEPDSKYPLWEAYSKENKNYKDLSVTFEDRAGYPNPQSCMFLRDVLPKLLTNAGTVIHWR